MLFALAAPAAAQPTEATSEKAEVDRLFRAAMPAGLEPWEREMVEHVIRVPERHRYNPSSPTAEEVERIDEELFGENRMLYLAFMRGFYCHVRLWYSARLELRDVKPRRRSV
jgi:hypothetical protein